MCSRKRIEKEVEGNLRRRNKEHTHMPQIKPNSTSSNNLEFVNNPLQQYRRH